MVFVLLPAAGLSIYAEFKMWDAQPFYLDVLAIVWTMLILYTFMMLNDHSCLHSYLNHFHAFLNFVLLAMSWGLVIEHVTRGTRGKKLFYKILIIFKNSSKKIMSWLITLLSHSVIKEKWKEGMNLLAFLTSLSWCCWNVLHVVTTVFDFNSEIKHCPIVVYTAHETDWWTWTAFFPGCSPGPLKSRCPYHSLALTPSPWHQLTQSPLHCLGHFFPLQHMWEKIPAGAR